MLTVGIFTAYTLTMFVVAGLAYRKNHSDSDYLLANRELTAWFAALSAGASDMSGWLLLGLPGLAFSAWSQATWLAAGLAVGTYLNWKYVAERLRCDSLKFRRALTLPEYFSARFSDKGKALRITTASITLFFYTFYISAGFVAAAKLFTTVFSIDYLSSLLLGTFIVVTYTLIGGFRAVVNTDVIQSIMMVIALVTLTFVLATSQPSAEHIIKHSADINGLLALSTLSILSALAWGLGYPGQPHILLRFMATKSATDIRRGARVGVLWTLICLFSAVAIGYLSSINPSLAPAVSDGESVFIVVAAIIFHPAIAAILSAAILAAIMSTADSQLLIAGTSLHRDLLVPLGWRSEGLSQVLAIRMAVAGISLLSFYLAIDPNNSVLELVSYAWAGFGATLGPALLISLYARKIDGGSVLIGMLAGGMCVVGWEMFAQHSAQIYSIVPGVIANFTACFVSANLRAVNEFGRDRK